MSAHVFSNSLTSGRSTWSLSISAGGRSARGTSRAGSEVAILPAPVTEADDEAWTDDELRYLRLAYPEVS